MKKEKEDLPQNPYLSGRREWNERYGSYIKQASTWRLIALISSGISIISILGVIYIGSQSKITPYVVQVDKLGQSVTSGAAEAITYQDERVVTASLASFITNLRTIWGEPKVQRKMILDAYKYIAPSSPAEMIISNSFRKEDPFQAMGKLQRNVQIKDVLKMAENTWQIDWEETSTASDGKQLGIDSYKALVQVKSVPPSTQEAIYNNPLGIFVTEYNFAKTI